MNAHVPAQSDDGSLRDLSARLDWVERRYMKNARDATFSEYLREVMRVDGDGSVLPEARRDPLNGETSGFLVCGASGDGKSVLIERNLKAQPGFEQVVAGGSGNWLRCTVSPEATIKGLGETISRETGYPGFATKVRAQDVWHVARTRLFEHGICLLVIDEAHHLLRRGTGRDRAGVLQTLKHLLQGEAAVAVVLSGIPILDRILLEDEETSRRFIRMNLQPVADGGHDAMRLATFILRCCEHVGLGPPDDPHFAERVLRAEHAGLGRAIRFSKEAIRRSLIDARPRIELCEAARLYEMRTGSGGLHPYVAGDWTTVRDNLVRNGWTA